MAGAAILIVYGKRLREKLKKAGAISKETARTIEELNLSKREIRTLKRNVWIGKVKKSDDHYYVECKDEKHC